MKTIFRTAFLLPLFYSLNSLAQNYSPIINGNTSLFNFNGSIEALHVDSTTVDPKGIAYHFIKTWDEVIDYQNCHPYHNATWAGAKCVVSGNTYYFFNKSLDTLVIKPTTEVNGSWKLYTYADNKYIQATISSKTFESFLTFTDSVKTISLQLKDVNGNSLSSDVNSLQLKLSKNYGWKQFCNAYHFPTYPSSAPLVGTTLPQAGLQLLSAKAIFDYQIGDEFHYEAHDEDPNNGVHIYTKTIQRVLNIRLSTNTDTIVYQMQRFREITHYSSSTTTYSADTIFESHVLNQPQFYPNQAIVSSDVNELIEQRLYFSYSYKKIDGHYNNRFVMESSQTPYMYNHDCWQFIQPEGYSSTYDYAAGIGMVNSYAKIFFQELHTLNLVYFKKGTEEWGTSLTLSTYSKKEQSTSLYPNPLQQGEELYFRSDNFKVKQIILYDATGTKVFESTLPDGKQSLSLTKIQPGLYVIQLMNDNNEYATNKLIIK